MDGRSGTQPPRQSWDLVIYYRNVTFNEFRWWIEVRRNYLWPRMSEYPRRMDYYNIRAPFLWRGAHLPHRDVVYGWDPACPWTHQGPLATSGWSLKAKEIQILYLRSKSVATASSSLLSYVSAAHSYLPHLHSWMCRSNSYSICKWQNCVPKKNKMQNISAELIRNHFHTLIHFEINWTLEYLWISCLSIGYAYAQQHL